MLSERLTFGIYPLSVAGTPFGVAEGPADSYADIRSALADLRGDRKLRSRTYLIYTPAWREKMLANAELYAANGVLDDIVIGVGDWTEAGEQEFELENWSQFIRDVIDRHAERLTSVQITNEPNLSFMEGSKGYVYEALTHGVVAAKREITRRGLDVEVGFGSVPDSPAAVPDFWGTLRATAGKEFLQSVDFVGHNFYLDVFEDEPVPTDRIPDAVDGVISALRNSLDALGLDPSVAIRVTENGWPTGKNPLTGRVRTETEQAHVLETIVRTVSLLREKYRISHYVLFGLRDADTRNEDLFHQYGVVHDDYSPKLAYASYRALIQELGA